MESINKFAETFAGMVWGMPLVYTLLGAGIIFTLFFFFPQIRLFFHSIAIISGKYENPDEPGEITHFQALTAALSATIGLGNIAGVAVAISAGGPGAVFWMWVAGFLGMATKFVSISLAMLHRNIDPDTGVTHGGPMYTIKNGLPKIFLPFAYLFAFFVIMGAFGMGNMFQSNQMANIIETTLGVPKLATGIVFMILAGLVLVGGIKRIGQVASKLVPTMVVIYLLAALGILAYHWTLIPHMLKTIFTDAFTGTAAVGGFAGIAFKEVVIQGVRRALFSNEAGLGSAAMAHTAAKSNPIQEGIVGMIGPFIDTIVVCTLTASVLLITGVWSQTNGFEGSELTAMAFSTVYGKGGTYVVLMAVILFAFSTIISWSYYGEQGVTFIFGEWAVKYYRWIFLAFVLIGSVTKLSFVLNFSDAFVGLMVIPNLIACFALIFSLRQKLKKYQADLKAGRI